jgi:hypothetical protein
MWQYVASSFDVGTVDTSGIGYSSDGDCVSQYDDPKINDIINCISPKRLYSIDRAVDELAIVMKMVGYKKNAVIGTSAGTIILRRLLQRYPSYLDWAIFEGIVTKKDETLTSNGKTSIEAMNIFKRKCFEDEKCKILFDKYGGIERVSSKYSTLNNRCVQEIMVNKEGLKRAMIDLAYNLGDIKKLIMAIVFRFTRCGQKDYQWLKKLYDVWLPSLGLGEKVKSNQQFIARKKRITFSDDVNYYQLIELLKGKNETEPWWNWSLPSSCKENDFVCYGKTSYVEIFKNPNTTIKPNDVMYKTIESYNGVSIGFAGDLDIETPLLQAIDWKSDFNTSGKDWFIELKGGEHGVFGPTIKIVDGKIQNLGPLILAEVLKTNLTNPLNETKIRQIFSNSLLAEWKSFEMNDYFRNMIGMDLKEPLFDETYIGDDWNKSNGIRIEVKIAEVIVAFICLFAIFLT